MRTALLAATLALLAAPACLAANANNPYGNINPANDAGNDTGDSQVEALNQAQLDSNGIARPRLRPRPPRNPFAYLPDRAPTYPAATYQTRPYVPQPYAQPRPYPSPYGYGYPPPPPTY